MEGAPAGTPVVRDDELALNFARALSLTGDDAHALAIYKRVVAGRTERLGPDHADTRAAAALLAGTVLAHAPTDLAVQRPTDQA
jgi:Tetratricopeptide repeat